jgi:hypothetical protein
VTAPRINWTVVIVAAMALLAALLAAALYAPSSSAKTNPPGYYLGPSSFGIELGGANASGWSCNPAPSAAHPGEVGGIACSLTSGPGLGR